MDNNILNDNSISKEEYKNWISTISSNFPYLNPAIPRDIDGNLIGSEDIFPIISGGAVYNNGTKGIPLEIIREVKEAGFTVCFQSSIGYEALKKTLLLGQQENEMLISSNKYFLEEGYNGNKDLGWLTYLGGIRLWDEPTYDDIVGNTETNQLQTNYHALMTMKNYPVGRNVIINLIGGPEKKWMNPNLPAGTTYDLSVFKEYVDAFQNYFKPSYFSYDRYPIREKSTLLTEGINSNPKYDGEGDITVDDGFFQMLEFFSDYTTDPKIDRPFWTFCQALSFFQLKSPYLFRPIALEQYLRFEAFSALAFGAKGIFYWNYAMAVTTSEECYLSALTDRRGNKTASWYYAQKVNSEIHKYRDIFLNAKFQKAAIMENGSLTFLSLRIASSNKKGVCASFFTKGLFGYIVLINTDPLNYQNLLITTKLELTELTPDRSGGQENLKIPVTKIPYPSTLIPGGYRIFLYPGTK